MEMQVVDMSDIALSSYEDEVVSLKARVRRLEKDLVRAQDFLQRLLETIVSAVLVADSSGAITLANGVASRMFSNFVPLKGMNVIDILPFDELLMKASPLEQSDSTLYGETSLCLAGNEQAIHVIYSISHVVDPSGEQEGLVCVFTDITSRKVLEQQLLQSQKLEAVGHLAAGVAHEINTPIQYIRDNTMFFRDEFQRVKDVVFPMLTTLSELNSEINSEDLTYAFEEIPNAIGETLEGIEAVADIVRSMKEFSHPGTVEAVKTDINQSLEATVTVCKNEWKYVANIAWELEKNLPLIACYPAEINQVVLNLIVNSAHAIEEKMLVTGDKTKGTITLRTKLIEDGVRIEISDSGMGIKQEIKDRIFEPFFTTKGSW
jgi:PAS domain S-box-containing protein